MSIARSSLLMASGTVISRVLGFARAVLLAAMIGVNAYVSYGNAVHAANEAYDRSLYLAARTLAEELTMPIGSKSLRLSYFRFE